MRYIVCRKAIFEYNPWHDLWYTWFLSSYSAFPSSYYQIHYERLKTNMVIEKEFLYEYNANANIRKAHTLQRDG